MATKCLEDTLRGSIPSTLLALTGTSTCTIYTDGSCIGNPGPGAYAAVVLGKHGHMLVVGREEQTTNQRMELLAVVKALEALPQEYEDVVVYCDSAYVVNGGTSYIYSWVQNGWKTAKGQPVVHAEVWQRLYPFLKRGVKLCKVKGHAGNVGNEYVDMIAGEMARGS